MSGCVCGAIWCRHEGLKDGGASWEGLCPVGTPTSYPQDVGMEGCMYLDASVLHDNQPPSLVCEWQLPMPAAPTRFCCRGQGGGLCFVRSHPGLAQGLSLCPRCWGIDYWTSEQVGGWAQVPGEAGW